MTENNPPIDKTILSNHLKIGAKLWFELDGEFIVGPGDAKLITVLQQTKNLTLAAKDCGYSYKYAWKKLKLMEKKIGQQIVIAKKGGYGGGGTVELTPWGEFLLQIFVQMDDKLKKFIDSMNQELTNQLNQKL
jgi:molybdate transport system regulatory protein